MRCFDKFVEFLARRMFPGNSKIVSNSAGESVSARGACLAYGACRRLGARPARRLGAQCCGSYERVLACNCTVALTSPAGSPEGTFESVAIQRTTIAQIIAYLTWQSLW